MSRPTIPDTDHILRYCSPVNVDGDAIIPDAFELSKGANHLSVNWMEYDKSNNGIENQLEAVRNCMIAKEYAIRRNGRFARFNVGDVKKRISGSNVCSIPEDNDPSHAGICANERNREFSLEMANMVGPADIFPAL